MFKRRLLTCSALLAAFALAGFSASRALADDKKPDEAKKDSKFVHKAALGGMTEVKVSELAKDRATNADLKQFAEMMVTDHGKANDELKAAAGSKGIEIPAMLDEKHQKKVDELVAKTGADFDKAYTAMMVSDHEETIALFKKESDKGEDSDLKAWAAKMLPALEEHLKKIKDIQGKM